jgi:hypothetical protein
MSKQPQSLATLAGFGVDTLELDRPFFGEWIIRAKLDIADNDAPPLGPFSCVFDDGNSSIEYNGTLIHSQADTGDAYVIGVGGQGKLGTMLPGVDYSQPQPRTIAQDIIAACGETIGDLSGLDSLSRIDPVFSCIASSASNQLQALCKLIIARWYTRPDGGIVMGAPTWPTYSGDPFIVHNPNAHGTIIAEPNIPDIEPGMVVGGFRIARLRYFINDDGLTAHLGVANE